ncbi:MAG: Stress response protein nst1 [Bogoriella megaspora]|nr:MAG: Stress response protein nst1 [Bogoriella megaspora]
MAQGTKGAGGQPPANITSTNGLSHPVAPQVNRKKQKRREKQAAKQAAEQQHQQSHVPNAVPRNGHVPQGQTIFNRSQAQYPTNQPELDYGGLDSEEVEYDPAELEEQDFQFAEDQAWDSPSENNTLNANRHTSDSHANGMAFEKRSKKKKRNKGIDIGSSLDGSMGGSHLLSHGSSSHIAPPPPPPPPLSSEALRTIKNSSKNTSIWNTSMAEERERIKEFWLSLSEKDRKGLVKIEKQTVLAKMKEQQKHSCSCTVCGRKRTAIEEELEVLYDAYYDELENYANRQQTLDGGMPMLPPARTYGHPMGHLSAADRQYHTAMSRKRLPDLPDDEGDSVDDEIDDDYLSGDDDESEEYSDDDDAEDIPRRPATDFLNFGQSLTVKGGILTVADDLLQNDGKKFIEMMEQLAERRMQREEEAQYAASGLSHSSQANGYPGHSHPLPEDDEFDDEDEDEYDSQEEYEEEDEMESMTEEQRMEEGRRMFQIFAARMFEQRVLTAYKEKVAKEKAEMLLQEQEEEERQAEERKAKKARDAQKKKAKKDLQKQAKAEEKAKKDAEKAAEEAAAKAAEEKKQEEQRKKKEEQRKKREAERKVQDEERQKKEAEKLKQQQKERERQQEAERKAREQKAQEKKAKEDARRKQREEQEAKEREARERKAAEEREKKDKEAKAKAEREKVEKEAAAMSAKPPQPQVPTIQKRPAQPAVITAPPGLRASPQIAPALPKAPTPASRQRQTSQLVSHGSSPGNSQAGPAIVTAPPGLASPMAVSSQTSSSSAQPPIMPKTILTKQSSLAGIGPAPNRTQPNSPTQPLHDPTHSSPFGQPFPTSPFAVSQPPGMPSLNQRAPIGFQQQGFHQPYPQQGGQFQQFPPGSLRGPPPGMGPPGMPPFGRGSPLDTPPGLGQPMGGFPGHFPPPTSVNTGPIGPPGHSRTSSASIEKSPLDSIGGFGAGHPITRPNPIQRPSSTKPHPEPERAPPPRLDESVDDLAKGMGSASLGGELLDDPVGSKVPEARGSGMAPGGPSNHLPGFGMSPLVNTPSSHTFGSLNGLPGMSGNWYSQGFPPSNVTTPSWGTATNPNNMWGSPGPTSNPQMPPFNNLGGPGAMQNPRDRIRQLRMTVCRVCRLLDNSPTTPSSSEGFHDLQDILHHLNSGIVQGPVNRDDVVDILDTLGDPQNGGGSFTTRQEGDRVLVRYESDGSQSSHGMGPMGGPLAGLGPPGQQTPGLGGRAFAPIGSQGFP